MLREAVASFKAQSRASRRSDWIARGAGYWKDRADIGDAVDYQRTIRDDRTPYDQV